MAKTQKPVDSDLPYKPDDDQLAQAIAHEWENKAAFFHTTWRVYDRGLWEERELPEVRRRIRTSLVSYRKNHGVAVTQSRISALASMLEDDCFISDRRIMQTLPDGTKYINLQNGLFNLDTFQLEPHRPELYLTNQLDFSFEPEAECPHFMKFLRTSLVLSDGTPDLDMIMLVQEALAYSMTARTDLKASFWLVGEPNSGKSTLIAFIRTLMGNLHATIDLNQLATNRFLLSGIVGKRVVTFTEADSTAFLPDALYKAMVGGTDEIFVDVKNKPGIAFVPTAKFWWAMNGAPRMNDRSGATMNRLMVVLFSRSVPQDLRVANLPQLLATEKAGVFNYLLKGYSRLVKTGKFTSPERSEHWREEYQRENDTEATYAEERWERDFNGKMTGQTLYSDYAIWCQNNGFRPKSIIQVAKEWRRLGLQSVRSNGHTNWLGATLKNLTI